jgi:hypothetical protein
MQIIKENHATIAWFSLYKKAAGIAPAVLKTEKYDLPTDVLFAF